jgi:hypothetical protein
MMEPRVSAVPKVRQFSRFENAVFSPWIFFNSFDLRCLLPPFFRLLQFEFFSVRIAGGSRMMGASCGSNSCSDDDGASAAIATNCINLIRAIAGIKNTVLARVVRPSANSPVSAVGRARAWVAATAKDPSMASGSRPGGRRIRDMPSASARSLWRYKMS